MRLRERFFADWLRRAAPDGMPPSLRRRAVLRAAAGLAASTVLAPATSREVRSQPRFDSYPFALGVASGCPRADSVVLWTRLVRDALAAVALTADPVELGWEIATDDKFRNIVQKGRVRALPELAHSVRVEANALEPASWYWYRFTAGDAVSPVGRTRTAPAAGSSPGTLAFAFASCQQYEQGYYAAYRHMAREDLHLVVFLGDYIYESSWGRDHVRKHATPEAYTLADYRVRYAQYKSDEDLQRMHAAAPWLVTWDDHEVQNDYANDRGQDLDPNFLARRTAAYQAFFEHMPLRSISTPAGTRLRLYDRYAFGDLAQFHMLDDRQYRSYQACQRPGRGGSNRVADCAERLDPRRTLLGTEQERWLNEGLAASTARWNVIGQQTLMAQLDRTPGPGQSFWNDGWDGYPAARSRLLAAAAKNKSANTIVISGDVHCTWVADLKTDFDDALSPAVATEFCGPSITSQGPSRKQVLEMMTDNPHVRYGHGLKHGYVKVELKPDACIATVRVLDHEKRPHSSISTLARFAVEQKRPGVQMA